VRIAVERNSRSPPRRAGLKACALCALRDDNPEKEEANIMEVYFGWEVLAEGTRRAHVERVTSGTIIAFRELAD
jgi:hypothetical protein